MIYFASSLISLILIFFFYFLAKKFSLYDIPNRRKTHKYPTPYTGGLILITSLIISFKFINYHSDIKTILNYGIFIGIIGFIDDKYILAPINKIIFKSFVLFFFLNKNYYLTSLGYYEYIGNIGLGVIGLLFSFLALHLLINAYNYIDGMDGIAITLFINAIIILFLINPIKQDLTNWYLLMISILMPILLINLGLFKPHLQKIFLGNNGSYFLGFLLGCLMIFHKEKLDIHPAKIIWCCPIMIFDFLSVNINRIKKRKNILEANRDHIHHILLKKTKSTFLSLTIINFANLITALIGLYLTSYFNEIFSIIFYIICFAIFYFTKNMILKKE
jgi:UDP-GlcNAc:undecaprenyl-phosphate GlcNAc-1-phosphate transferase